MVVLTLTFETTDDFYAVHKYQTMSLIERYPLNHLASENLVANGDLLIDSNSDGVPDGFYYSGNTTDKTLVNGIAKFTATARYGCIRNQSPNVFDVVSGNTYYFYSKVKTATSSCAMLLSGIGQDTSIITDNNWHFTSKIFTASADYTGSAVRINDDSTSDFTPIEVDYVGAINITDLVSRGILPSGLTNTEYKEILDNIFSLQGYQLTNSIFNPESNEEIHLSSNTEGDQEVLYIGLDNYGTLDTSFKLGISQMNGQFTFNYIIVDSTE